MSKRISNKSLLKIYKYPLPGIFLNVNSSTITDKISIIFKIIFNWIKYTLNLYSREFKAIIVNEQNTVHLIDLNYHSLGLQLWTGGFFGKGTLSRGEPTWFYRMSTGSTVGESMSSIRSSALKPHAIESTLKSNEDLEKYQLMPEEAFFLSFAIDILQVSKSEQEHPLNCLELWRTFSHVSKFPNKLLSDIELPQLISHFAIRYTVYHHYRSLGWIVKCGLKFGSEFVLYKKGPLFRHSDYVVTIIPTFDDNIKRNSRDNFTWLLGTTRVASQVKKKLLICYVVIPNDFTFQDLEDPDCLYKLKIWDTCISRWVPSRTLI